MSRDDLKARADALLRRAGFVDIESPGGAITDGRHGREPDPTREEYYRAAEEQLLRFPWRSDLHRDIWWKHCQGTQSRGIARALKLHRNTVNGVIARVREAMRDRVWRRRGRPEVPGGRGMGCHRMFVRFTDRETDALFALADAWGCSRLAAVRRAVVAAACAISDIRKGRK